MAHKKLSIPIPDEETGEILTALLADAGFEGFEETGDVLYAFVGSEKYDEQTVKEILGVYHLKFEIEEIEKTNWNEDWEKNFQPVIVEDFCTVRADFHRVEVNTTFEIIITPKMSFGTGHHATTQLMMSLMKEMDFASKTVLDFGAGTGILAILASLLRAQEILAIDNDAWCYENAMENIARNHTKKIEVKTGSLEAAGERKFDIILANINRHILLQYMNELYGRLNENGSLLLSGILEEDQEIICTAADKTGFKFIKGKTQHNWLALQFLK